MEVNMEPLVSVVVITYNQEDSLPKVLDSILAQDCSFGFEVVVGEDCSKDNTRKVLENYSVENPDRIIPVYQESNVGILKNFISAVTRAKGKYLAFCDGDDYWIDSRKLAKQVAVMEENHAIGLVYSDVLVNSVITGESYYRRMQCPRQDLFTQLLEGNIIVSSTVCMRRELLRFVDFEMFVKQGFKMEDYPMWLTFSLHTKFYHLKRPTITYRIERQFINDAKTVSLHACEFDEGTTAIRLYFLRKYPDRTNLTENDIMDAHYKICYLAGMNMNDRKYTKKYVDLVSDRTPYIMRLSKICESRMLFFLYQMYRKLLGKQRTPLQMYFGQ